MHRLTPLFILNPCNLTRYQNHMIFGSMDPVSLHTTIIGTL
jgi:hypothetical protein